MARITNSTCHIMMENQHSILLINREANYSRALLGEVKIHIAEAPRVFLEGLRLCGIDLSPETLERAAGWVDYLPDCFVEAHAAANALRTAAQDLRGDEDV